MPRVDGAKLLQHLKFKLTLRTDWYCHQLKKHTNYPGIIFTIIFLVCFGVIIAFYGLEKQTNQHNDRRTNKQRLIQIGIQIRGLYPVHATRYTVAGSRINTITIDYKLH